MCTLGLARLVFHWKPDWMLRCTHEVCPLAEATKVRLVDQYDQIFVEDVRIITPYSVRYGFLLLIHSFHQFMLVRFVFQLIIQLIFYSQIIFDPLTVHL